MIMKNKTNIYLILSIIKLLSNSVFSERNRFIRVDGISPTCFQRSHCRSYSVVGAVISVDKSLPYMGSNMCCLTFEISNEKLFNENGFFPSFMTHILNSTILEGNDFISIFEGDEKSDRLIKNITANDKNPYDPIYLKSSQVTFEFYKDREYRSIYEIVISVYHEGDSPVCKLEDYHRCGSNKSICIDQDLLCDKFPHCMNESDESEACGNSDPSLSYDKLTVAIVLGVFIGFILMSMFLIFLLCFF